MSQVCPQCGEKNADDARLCGMCSIVLPEITAPPPNAPKQSVRPGATPQQSVRPGAAPQPVRPGAAPTPRPMGPMGRQPQPVLDYAGFWLRVLASLIDSFVMSIVIALAIIPFFISLGIQGLISMVMGSFFGKQPPVLVLLYLFIIPYLIQFAYFTLTEGSDWQASLGKLACGIKVTDLNGNRIGFGQAFSRYFAAFGPVCIAQAIAIFVPKLAFITILTSLYVLISCIAAGLTEKKQGWHDGLTECLVVKK